MSEACLLMFLFLSQNSLLFVSWHFLISMFYHNSSDMDNDLSIMILFAFSECSYWSDNKNTEQLHPAG